MNTNSIFRKYLLACTILFCMAGHNFASMAKPQSIARDDAFSRSFHWDFEGCTYDLTYRIPWETYHFYQEKPRVFKNFAVYGYENRQHPFLGDFVQTLVCKAEAAGLDRSQTLGFVIAFVQQMEYRNDQGEYPKFPVETIAEFGGDCEDTSILLAAMLREMGYETVMINPPGHMAMAVACDACKGVSYEYGGRNYYYVETTATGFGVGDLPEDYRSTRDKIIPMTASSVDLWVLHAFVPRRVAASKMLYFVSEDEGLMAKSQRGEEVVAKATVRSIAMDGTVSTSRKLERIH